MNYSSLSFFALQVNFSYIQISLFDSTSEIMNWCFVMHSTTAALFAFKSASKFSSSFSQFQNAANRIVNWPTISDFATDSPTATVHKPLSLNLCHCVQKFSN